MAYPYSKELLKLFEEIENMDDDGDNELLHNAVEWYCSMHDIRTGLKCALTTCLEDQYMNHGDEQPRGDIERLQAMLKPKP